RQYWFLHLGLKPGRLQHLHQANFWSGEQHIESFDLRLESPLLELGQNPLSVVFVVRRSNMMRTRAQAAHVLANVLRRDAVLQFSLPIALGCRALRTVSRDRERRGCSGLAKPGLR